MTFAPSRRAALTLASAGFFIPVTAFAQGAGTRSAAAPDAELQAAIAKSNAYTALMNRTLRAIESWQRYRSWVNIQQGPTGRERYISYGLYSLYDVRSELEKAEAATAQEPAIPDLDDAMRRYIQSYRELAPLITRANGYYERKDYEDDRMALGRELHRQMVPAAEAFLKDRTDVEAAMKVFRTDLNRRELADIERREGRSARWHVRNVLIAARGVMDLMPSNESPRVDMAAFDGAIAAYAAALREMDKLKETDPDGASILDSQASSWLGSLREYRQKLARANGDGRRAAGHESMWIVNNYNMMVSMSESRLRMRR
ncbi:YiiG family protein [Phreatobacter oligotrophus]|uniref:YiiG family protein n=1 Tax=Phreatobacter oligotrophus TaxID=1122261 RepID=UPI002352DC13|nr:YiiG family protein [Phreatobacter oligotrophus]MBX9989677.1 YiiG family protein [Phreatobacter oligotrophus]